MTNGVVLTVSLTGTAVVLLALVLRRRVWTFTGALMALAACLFHGLGELVNTLRLGENRWRPLLSDEEMESWLMWAGPAVLLFTVAYLIGLGQARLVDPSTDRAGTEASMRFFRPWLCVLATAPLYLLSIWGRGFVPGSSDEGGYFEAGITTQFLLFGVSFTAVAFVTAGTRLVVAAAGQSAALALLGQRTAVGAGLLLLVFVLERLGRRSVTRREAMMLVLLAVVSAVALSSARVEAGRGNFAGGAGPYKRATALASGVLGVFDGDTRAQLADDYIYRVDGNSFPALVLARQKGGYAPTGLRTVGNSFRLAVPSFVDPGKRARAAPERDEIGYLRSAYNLPLMGYLPTMLGAVAYFGPVGLLLLSPVAGLMFALVERRLRRNGPVRLVVASGLVVCALYYERGFQVIPITMRGALSLALVVGITRGVQQVVRRRPARHCSNPFA